MSLGPAGGIGMGFGGGSGVDGIGLPGGAGNGAGGMGFGSAEEKTVRRSGAAPVKERDDIPPLPLKVRKPTQSTSIHHIPSQLSVSRRISRLRPDGMPMPSSPAVV